MRISLACACTAPSGPISGYPFGKSGGSLSDHLGWVYVYICSLFISFKIWTESWGPCRYKNIFWVVEIPIIEIAWPSYNFILLVVIRFASSYSNDLLPSSSVAAKQKRRGKELAISFNHIKHKAILPEANIWLPCYWMRGFLPQTFI